MISWDFLLDENNRNIYIAPAILILHMIQKYSRHKILDIFFMEPRRKFLIREISRKTGLSQPPVRLHLKQLVKDGLVITLSDDLYGGYKANRDNDLFKLLKQQNTVFVLHQSGCIKMLSDKLMPQAIILFGSAAKGEDVEESDVDLFIEGEEEDINLERFEKMLNRKINILFEKDFKAISKELKNNIINGIKLHGFLRAF